jgi:hypothetical protein
MLAFWLLAVLAAVITSLGLHESGATVSVRGAPAAPVTPTAPAQLVLGETLRPAGVALPTLAVLGHAAAQPRTAAAEALTSSTRAPLAHPTRVRSTAATKPTTRHPVVRPTVAPIAAPAISPGRRAHGKGLAKGQVRKLADGHGHKARGKSGH